LLRVAQRGLAQARVRWRQRAIEGSSFSEFVLGERLARLHRVLSDPRMSARLIGAIAMETGFGDLSYFNRAFRRRYGASPSDVRGAARDKK